ncbi:hypothetical protein Dimus_015169 [Dionaea muscipula]
MELGKDFLDSLDIDTSVKVLMYLDDPCDVVRVGSVSRFWHDFVISNSVCKQLCLRLFPQLSSLVRVVDITDRAGMPAEAGSSRSIEWEHEDREHKIYASLAWGLTSSKMSDSQRKSCVDFQEGSRVDDTTCCYGATLQKDPSFTTACSGAAADPSTFLIRGEKYLQDQQKVLDVSLVQLVSFLKYFFPHF